VAGPLLSIITPTLNRARYLGEAIESVCAQGFADFEHIIVDGGSTDDTPAVLARHPHLRVIREPDKGLYDAMNKGLRAARGKFVGILNSDDLYAPGVFARAVVAGGESEVISGGAEVFSDQATVLRAVRTPADIALDLRNVLSGIPLLNARFFRRSFIEGVGEFDLAYRIAADREWLFRAVLAKPRETIVPELFYRYRQHDGSLTFDDADRSSLAYREEHAAFAEKHLARTTLPAEVRRKLRRYHTRESVSVAAVHWQAGRREQVQEWARRGREQNALWPLWFAKRLAGQALGR
jgi:glycosyltransferase involved in cell wall biosynthesis